MANDRIEDVEGIGPVLGEKLRAAGVKDTDSLLIATRTPKQRADLAAAADISPKLILRFANMADLYRIDGVGSEFSELLEAAGVDTVPELAQRNAENLTAAMVATNEDRKLTRRTPSVADVTKWVAQAKQLPRALEY